MVQKKKKRRGKRRVVKKDLQNQGFGSKLQQQLHATALENYIERLEKQKKERYEEEWAWHEAKYADLMKNLNSRGIFEKIS